MGKQLITIENQLTRTKRPSWLRRHIIQININQPQPAQQQTVIENHPAYLAVLKALNERRVSGELVGISSHKPQCDAWHEVYAIELGHYWYERRVVFALVRI